MVVARDIRLSVSGGATVYIYSTKVTFDIQKQKGINIPIPSSPKDDSETLETKVGDLGLRTAAMTITGLLTRDSSSNGSSDARGSLKDLFSIINTKRNFTISYLDDDYEFTGYLNKVQATEVPRDSYASAGAEGTYPSDGQAPECYEVVLTAIVGDSTGSMLGMTLTDIGV